MSVSIIADGLKEHRRQYLRPTGLGLVGTPAGRDDPRGTSAGSLATPFEDVMMADDMLM